jgi:protein translocase SecG subunit
VILPILAAAAAPLQKATAAATSLSTTIPLSQLQQYTINPSRSPLAQNVPWLTHLFAGVFVVAALLLIVLLAVQTTKQEGLSGTIGGRVESAYRGRLGGDQQIARFTTYVAVVFILFGTLLSLTGI